MGGSKTCVRPPLCTLVSSALVSDVKLRLGTEDSFWPPACHSAPSYLAAYICYYHWRAADRQKSEV